MRARSTSPRWVPEKSYDSLAEASLAARLEALEHAVEARAADAGVLGGLHDDAVALLEHAVDVGALELLDDALPRLVVRQLGEVVAVTEERRWAGLRRRKEARAIANTDVVFWYTFGHTHIPRAEDYPVMPTAYIGFTLKPNGFFTMNPANDVPPSEAKKSCCAE